MYRLILLNHVVISLLLTVPYLIFNVKHHIFGLHMGLTLAGLDFLLLVWAFHRIFLKKSIALAVSVIVCKYAILGTILFTLVTNRQIAGVQVTTGSLLVGLSGLFLHVVFFGFEYHQKWFRGPIGK